MAEPITTVLGRVQPLYKGSYVHGQEYDYLDNVLYQKSTYVSLINGNINNYPTDTRYWQLISAQGEIGPQGQTGSFGTHNVGTVNMINPDEPAEVTITTDPTSPDTAKNFIFEFDIPKGPKGLDSVEADATSLPAGESPTVEASLEPQLDETTKLVFEFGIPAADGEGVKKVDTIGPSESGNVELGAVSYSRDQTQGTYAISEGQKIIARTNIQALKEPIAKTYGSFLRYAGDVSNPEWISEPILQVPNGGTPGYVLRKQNSAYGWTPAYEVPAGGSAGAALVKNSNSDYDFGWTGAITDEDIDDIIEE